jgi:hypothetical protein
VVLISFEAEGFEGKDNDRRPTKSWIRLGGQRGFPATDGLIACFWDINPDEV